MEGQLGQGGRNSTKLPALIVGLDQVTPEYILIQNWNIFIWFYAIVLLII